MEIKTGGNAFPQVHSGGMSLRDYFAAKAIGLFGLEEKHIELIQKGSFPHHKLVAKFCYDLADAMLQQREEE